jgi:hypothetical protein
MMEKILNYKDLIDGKQIASVYGEYGNWVSIDEWLDDGTIGFKPEIDIDNNEDKYYLLFSNDTLKTMKSEHSEELYLVTAIHKGLELFVLDYYYINSIKDNKRWSVLSVIKEIEKTKELKEIINFKKTYFVHDRKSFFELGIALIQCVNDIPPHRPLTYYVG